MRGKQFEITSHSSKYDPCYSRILHLRKHHEKCVSPLIMLAGVIVSNTKLQRQVHVTRYERAFLHILIEPLFLPAAPSVI